MWVTGGMQHDFKCTWMNIFNFNNLLNSLNRQDTIRHNQEIVLFLIPYCLPTLSDLHPAAGWYSRPVSSSCIKNSSQMIIQISIFHPIQSFHLPPSGPWSRRKTVEKGTIFYFALLDAWIPIHSIAFDSPRIKARGKRWIRRKQKDWLSWSCCKLVVSAFLWQRPKLALSGGVL